MVKIQQLVEIGIRLKVISPLISKPLSEIAVMNFTTLKLSRRPLA
jgi:hypothetical protein